MIEVRHKALIGTVLFTPQYTPYTDGVSLFSKLKASLFSEDLWNNRVSVDRQVFEELLSQSEELQFAYIEEYSSEAEFILVMFSFENIYYEFYCMLKTGDITMIFFRNGA